MTVCGFRSVCGWLLRYFSSVVIFLCVFETYYNTDETFLLCFLQRGRLQVSGGPAAVGLRQGTIPQTMLTATKRLNEDFCPLHL